MLHIDWSQSDVDVATFMRDYWQRKPLFIKGGLANFQPSITPDELAGLACEEDVESRIIIERGATPWQLLRGPFDDNSFADLPDSHWTLLVQSVDLYDPEVAELLEAFRFIPNWRLDDIMISFAVPGGSVGPHYDQYDVFLVQGIGAREWQVGPVCDSYSPRVQGTPLHILSEFTANTSYTCEAGDILYLPPGYAHFGVAKSDCMTYSVGFRAPSVGQLLDQFAHHGGETSDPSVRFNDANRVVNNTNAITHQDIATVRQLIEQQLQDDHAIANWFGRFMTECKHPPDALEEPLIAREVPEFLQEYTLQFTPGARLAYFEQGTSINLFANGEQIDCDAIEPELIKALADLELHVTDELHNNPLKYAKLIAQLVNVGVFSIE